MAARCASRPAPLSPCCSVETRMYPMAAMFVISLRWCRPASWPAWCQSMFQSAQCQSAHNGIHRGCREGRRNGNNCFQFPPWPAASSRCLPYTDERWCTGGRPGGASSPGHEADPVVEIFPQQIDQAGSGCRCQFWQAQDAPGRPIRMPAYIWTVPAEGKNVDHFCGRTRVATEAVY
jgi:hypothetical protein